jgi:hypothetical protein
MTVEELFRKLSYGELSNLAIAVDNTGAIKKDKRNQMVFFANEALMRLHLRFPLIMSEKIIEVPLGGHEEPFEPDVLQVLSIMTAWGESLVFGTQPIPGAFYVHNRVLHIPHPVGSELQVSFQHRHPELTPIVEDSDLNQEIQLMPELEEALTAYIASKVYAAMNTADAAAAANTYRNRFDGVCSEVVNLGLIPGEYLPQQKFHKRGWV